MGLFSGLRAPRDRVDSEDLADFGRYWLLRDAGGLDSMTLFQALDPLREPLYAGRPGDPEIAAELRRHAAKGEWELIGAWQFSRDFVEDEELERELTDAALLALERMRITNLSIHLPTMDIGRFEELTGAPAPNDGFFGPPVFDSSFGPSRQFYFDKAVSAAAARSPQRIPTSPGVAPGPVQEAVRSMWNFGQLILRGPDVVNADIRFEPNTILPAREAATGVDHALFLDAVAAHLFADDCTDFGPWSLMGAGRFTEDYLEPSLLGSPQHVALVDAGLEQLVRAGILGTGICPEVLSPFEQQRLDARR